MKELFKTHDALAIGELVRARKIGAQELRTATVERLHALNTGLNAITDFYDDAPPAADGPFMGVPFVIKQLMADCEIGRAHV